MQKIWSFVKGYIFPFIKKMDFRDVVLVFVSALALLYYFQYRHYYNNSLTPTIVYYDDSITYYKNKAKEEYASKAVYVQTISQLKNANTELAEELKKLKDDPIVITQTLIKYRTDTIKTHSDEIIKGDSIYTLKWSKDEQNYRINGRTQVVDDFSQFQTTIDDMEVSMNMKLDIVEDGDNFRIITRSDNPYVTIENTDGVVIDPNNSDVMKRYMKQNRWHIGPQVGYGLSGSNSLSPYIGIGISYDLFSW